MGDGDHDQGDAQPEPGASSSLPRRCYRPLVSAGGCLLDWKSRLVAGVISSTTTPMLMARNSTWVTRSIGAGPHPHPCVRERTNALIQSTRRASVPGRRRSPARPAGRRWSWSGPGDGRRARPAGFPGPAAAPPPAPGAPRSARRSGRQPGRSHQRHGASRRARTRPWRRRGRPWPPPRSPPPQRSSQSGGSVASARKVAACQPAWGRGPAVTSGTTAAPPVRQAGQPDWSQGT
jgi:hypothetical protein